MDTNSGAIIGSLAKILPEVKDSFSLRKITDWLVHELRADSAWLLSFRATKSYNILAESSASNAMLTNFIGSTGGERLDRLEAIKQDTLKDELSFVIYPGSEPNVKFDFFSVPIRNESGEIDGALIALYSGWSPDSSLHFSTLELLAIHISLLWRVQLVSVEPGFHISKLENKHNIIFESSPIPINAFNSAGRCIVWNMACTELFGWSVDEVQSHENPLSLFYPDQTTLAEVLSSISAAFARGSRDWHPLTKSGKILTTRWSNIELSDGLILNIGLDVTEEKRLEAELKLLAATDHLTGLLNRRECLTKINAEIQHGRRYPGRKSTALLMNLDHFKKINDTHGHLAGDAVICHFAEIIKLETRSIDIAARIGGEEFFIFLLDAGVESALVLADRMIHRLRCTPFTYMGTEIRLTVSIGVSELSKADVTPQDLFKRTDEAMYKAKKLGRNRVEAL